jgi:hypothetical protein
VPRKRKLSNRRESSLHKTLKALYAGEGNQVEVPVGNYLVDVIREDVAIEIQTGNFSALKFKLIDLLQVMPVLVVYPLVHEKYILRMDVDSSQIISKRKSPRKGKYLDLFNEIVRIPEIIVNPYFSLEVLLVNIDEIWVNDGCGSWRRKYWSITDRKLKAIIDRKTFTTPKDYLDIFNAIQIDTFEVKDIALVLGVHKRLASRIAYTMRIMGLWEVISKRRNAYIYQVKQGL